MIFQTEDLYPIHVAAKTANVSMIRALCAEGGRLLVIIVDRASDANDAVERRSCFNPLMQEIRPGGLQYGMTHYVFSSF